MSMVVAVRPLRRTPRLKDRHLATDIARDDRRQSAPKSFVWIFSVTARVAVDKQAIFLLPYGDICGTIILRKEIASRRPRHVW